MTVQKNLDFPWSMEDTIENLKELKEILQEHLRRKNYEGQGERDVKEIAFDFDRAIQALEEVEQYRALGTVEELTNQKHNLSVAYKCIEELQQKDWIPFEQREADEEEKEYWLKNYGQEIEYMLCGRLPDEDEEIIVSYANGCVGEDTFMCDGCECYLDSGNEFITEAIAWMPKPQPYKKEGAE